MTFRISEEYFRTDEPDVAYPADLVAHALGLHKYILYPTFTVLNTSINEASDSFYISGA
jgi:hypothetical protein